MHARRRGAAAQPYAAGRPDHCSLHSTPSGFLSPTYGGNRVSGLQKDRSDPAGLTCAPAGAGGMPRCWVRDHHACAGRRPPSCIAPPETARRSLGLHGCPRWPMQACRLLSTSCSYAGVVVRVAYGPTVSDPSSAADRTSDALDSAAVRRALALYPVDGACAGGRTSVPAPAAAEAREGHPTRATPFIGSGPPCHGRGGAGARRAQRLPGRRGAAHGPTRRASVARPRACRATTASRPRAAAPG
jgi:hypothetical protein